MGIVAAGRASHFAPALVDPCQAGEVEFLAIAQVFSDKPMEPSCRWRPPKKNLVARVTISGHYWRNPHSSN